MMSVQVAKSLMKKWEAFPPPPGENAGEFQEVFRHAIFVNGTEAQRKAIMLASSESKYRNELTYPWDHYFGTTDLAPLLRGKAVLDLGCFTGGRGAAWFERYQLGFLTGIDVKQEFIDAATQFARLKKIAAEYRVAQGERLPFEDNTLDAILSYDVFEHVQNVRHTLGECHRVLKKGGRLFVVFPGYFHPTEHHLALATKLPCIHYFFSGETLVRAYNEILEERGEGAYWYKRQSPQMEPWERGNTINGTTLAQFRRFIRERDWNVVLHARKPIGSIGRNASQMRALALLSRPFGVAANIPGLSEMFLHRITYILQKGGS
jgi:ubiquinone/menaquinone biosynthesis C-methylase UbiE